MSHALTDQPEQAAAHGHEDHPRDGHRDQAQLARIVLGDQLQRDPEQGREDAEVDVGPAVHREALDAQGVLGDPEVTVPDGVGLQVEEVGGKAEAGCLALEVGAEVEEDQEEEERRDADSGSRGQPRPAPTHPVRPCALRCRQGAGHRGAGRRQGSQGFLLGAGTAAIGGRIGGARAMIRTTRAVRARRRTTRLGCQAVGVGSKTSRSASTGRETGRESRCLHCSSRWGLSSWCLPCDAVLRREQPGADPLDTDSTTRLTGTASPAVGRSSR